MEGVKNIFLDLVAYCKDHLWLAFTLGVAIVIVVIAVIWNIDYFVKLSRAKRNGEQQDVMSFWRKLLEVLIQIALLPVAAIITALMLFMLTLIFYFVSYGGYYLEKWILGILKDYAPEKGTTYYVQPSDNVSVTETFSGDYKVEVKHDDGERYQMSGSEFGVWVLAFFALPLRIITLALSILALFIPPLQIKAYDDWSTSFWSIVFDIAEK